MKKVRWKFATVLLAFFSIFVFSGCNVKNTEKYIITFDSCGGSNVSQINNVISGEKITKPATPVLDGYFFMGWYKSNAENAVLWDWNTDVVTESITLYAKWFKNSDDGMFFDKAEKLLTEDFLTENKTHYPFTADGLPEYRCQIIDNNSKFNDAFVLFPQEVDFEREILIVYLFTDIYYGFDCKLQSVTRNENEILIEVFHEMAKKDADGATPPSTSMPIQRCFVVKVSDYANESVKVNVNYS